MTVKVFKKVDNMRAILIALLMTIASQAGAECGNLCDGRWWDTATKADLQAELDAGADVMALNDEGKTPLHIAAAFGKPKHIYTLLSAGADVMARDGYDYTPLHDAETSEAIEILLAAGADITAQGRNGFTPLHEAGTLESIFALVAAGADVMAKEAWNNTPLHRAAANGTPATIKALLAAGASVSAKNAKGQTPLHKAADMSTSENIKTLLSAGADVMVQDSVGDTALHLAAACMLCEPGVIQTLLTAGADIRIKNYYRDTPLEVAQKNEILKGTRDYWELVLNAAAVVEFTKPDCPPVLSTSVTPWHDCFGDGLKADGSHYLGIFQNGKFHEHGTLHLINGDNYVGEFKEGEQHGVGRYTFANGDQYIGEFQSGRFHGQGFLTLFDGSLVAGIWKAGQPTKEEKGTSQDGTNLKFFEGADEYTTEAIALGLSNLIADDLYFFMTDSHFIHGPTCSAEEPNCRQQLRFEVNFRTATFDLNQDGVDEVFVWYSAPGQCGSGGCSTYVLQQKLKNWEVIGRAFPGGKVVISPQSTNGYFDFYYYGKTAKYSCKFDESAYDC